MEIKIMAFREVYKLFVDAWGCIENIVPEDWMMQSAKQWHRKRMR